MATRHVDGQLDLLPPEPSWGEDWRLPPEVIEAGLRGIPRARRALEEARARGEARTNRPEADGPTRNRRVLSEAIAAAEARAGGVQESATEPGEVQPVIQPPEAIDPTIEQ